MPPPFGSGYSPNVLFGYQRRNGFNCAAPFRERLRVGRVADPGKEDGLQLCRPLSGAVNSPAAAG